MRVDLQWPPSSVLLIGGSACSRIGPRQLRDDVSTRAPGFEESSPYFLAERAVIGSQFRNRFLR